MKRYGLEWSSPTTFLAKPLPDGYWTPWHEADAKVQRLREALRAIAEGNLGPESWQADYAKIRKAAQDALDA